MLGTVVSTVNDLHRGIKALTKSLDHEGDGDPYNHAKQHQGPRHPRHAVVREAADKLETMVSDDLWPLPTYREMLFIK